MVRPRFGKHLKNLCSYHWMFLLFLTYDQKIFQTEDAIEYCLSTRKELYASPQEVLAQINGGTQNLQKRLLGGPPPGIPPNRQL